MLFSHIMKQNSNTCNNMDETWKYFTEENKPNRKRTHTHTQSMILFLRKANSRKPHRIKKKFSSYQAWEEGKESES